MKALERQAVCASFWDQLKTARERVLLLDYDGTLAPFSVNRDQAFPYPEVPELIEKIRSQGTRVILVTGRAARELIPLSGIHPHPEIWGSHGMERVMPDGTYFSGTLPDEEHEGLLLAAQRIEAEGLERRMELKPGGIAMHWRGESPDEVRTTRDRVLRAWRPLLDEYQVRLLEFDGGLELRASEWSKGSAVSTILNELGEEAAVAYLGDDSSDEDAFAALKGRGLSVLVRPEQRTSAADVWLRPPEGLTEFLREWLQESRGEL
ncbi:MAG TPA: trehalose-phosphatase [Terriglobales bacterium]|jgi:trehalose-phosphatase